MLKITIVEVNIINSLNGMSGPPGLYSKYNDTIFEIIISSG